MSKERDKAASFPWDNLYRMKERIIVVPNTVDLANTLAYHNRGLFNTRIFTPVEFAQEALVRAGKLCSKKIISRNEELALSNKIVNEIDYFGSKRLSDIKNIDNTISTMRKLIINDERVKMKECLGKGIFTEKNRALLETYERYIDCLEKEDKIDSIGLIRYVLDENESLGSEIATVKEYRLQPLEKELVDKVSNGTCKEISLSELFGIDDDQVKISDYRNCYGISNEVSIIIDDIFKEGKPDTVTIACSDYGSYAQVFFDYACRYDIPISFGEGISLMNSYPGKLLREYHYWKSLGNYGWQPFMKMIKSPYFDYEKLMMLTDIDVNNSFLVDNFLRRASRLRLTDNEETNERTINDFEKAISREDVNDNYKLKDLVPGIKAVAHELSLPIEVFIRKYARIRDEERLKKLDEAAISSIDNDIKMCRSIGMDIDDDIIGSILHKSCCRQSSEAGKIYLTSIDRALFSIRDNLYICGLSANLYPGSPKENPLLLDSDLKDFGNSDLSSEGKIKDKRNHLLDLVRLASGLGNSIHLSYSGLNISELNSSNPSSLLYEMFKLEKGNGMQLNDFEKNIMKVSYFEPHLSISRNIGMAYNDSLKIVPDGAVKATEGKESLALKKYSPSALNTFFNCRKQFFYQNILRIPQPDDYLPFETIPANEQGTLVHSLMEYLSDHPMKRDEFLDFASKVFDEYMDITVPLLKDNTDATKNDFLEMLENGYDMDQKYRREVAFKEEDKITVHKATGINIHGYPDRVEIDENGKAVIIDFKTERDFDKHKEDDIDTCLQVLIYAYIVEDTMGLEIDHCEYRMLRYADRIIKCRYDDEMKAKLDDKLMEFKEAIENGDFEIGTMTPDEEKEICKYCKYGSICGKVVAENDNE